MPFTENPKPLMPYLITAWVTGGDTALTAATKTLVDLEFLRKDYGPTFNTFMVYNGDGAANLTITLDGKPFIVIGPLQPFFFDWLWKLKFTQLEITSDANVATGLVHVSVGNTGMNGVL